MASLPLAEPHLVDTSAWSKARNAPELARLFDDSVRRGMVATCDLVALELLRGAQNNDRFTRQSAALGSLRPILHYDLIAAVTGQRVCWIAAPGSLP